MVRMSSGRTTSSNTGSSNMAAGSNQLTDAIRKKAYELYEKRGRKSGHAAEDWLEEEIRSFIDAVVQGTPSVVPGWEGRRALVVALRILDEIKKAQDKVL